MADVTSFTPLASLATVALDTETTGLDLRSARIVQIATLPLQGAKIMKSTGKEWLINPGIPIPAAATRIHGLSDADVAKAPRFATVFPLVQNEMLTLPIIGFQTEYDLAIIEKECRLSGVIWQRPRFLDVRLLAHAVSKTLRNGTLETLAAAFGLQAIARHTAAGDAATAAEIYARLIPELNARGIRTLAEAETASREALDELTRANRLKIVRGGGRVTKERKPEPVFVALDSYPYRHKVREIMAKPVFVKPSTGLKQAAALMVDRSSLFVEMRGGFGIVTQRDLLWAFANQNGAGQEQTLGEIANFPLQSVFEDDYVYRAIGRMDRLKIRHLAVVNDRGDVTGVVSAREFLRQRASTAIALGDEIDHADGIEALGVARAKLATVAKSLIAEDVTARTVAEVISAELCALTARAAVLAQEFMMRAGKSAPPCPFAVLILGSAGRGESLLSADQDNAIVFLEGEPDGLEDVWFKEFGAKVSEILDTVGVPYCPGGVMGKNAAWRHSEMAWKAWIDGWIGRSLPQDILDIDVFFDAKCVYGDPALAERIINYAWERGSSSSRFLKFLSDNAKIAPPWWTLWGSFRTDEAGRIDLKKTCLLPIFTAARVLALKHDVRARGSRARLYGVSEKGFAALEDIHAIDAAHILGMTYVLRQQIADLDRGIPPSSTVDLSSLIAKDKKALRRALTDVERATDLVSEGLS